MTNTFREIENPKVRDACFELIRQMDKSGEGCINSDITINGKRFVVLVREIPKIADVI